MPGFVDHQWILRPIAAINAALLRRQVADPALRERLRPTDEVGCKRLLVSNDWYPTFTRPNVELVTDGIAQVTPTSIIGTDGVEREVDVIIFGTGFNANGFVAPMQVTGRDGLRLADAWDPLPQAYLGTAVSGFPNLFMLYGPNTNLGHNSITFMLERQIEYTVKAIGEMHARNLAAMELKQSAQDRFNKELQAGLAKTTWADPHCHSWYKNAKGHITQNWSSHTRDYAEGVKNVKWEDYTVRERKPMAAE